MERTLADFTARYPIRVAPVDGPTASIGLLTALGVSAALWATIIAAVIAVV
jgi:hypothetical protein